MKHKLIITSAAITISALTACGSPGNIIAHGTETDCTGTVNDGQQVTVTDSSNHVIATGTLTVDNSKTAVDTVKQYDQLQVELGVLGDSSSSGMSIYDFTVTVPAGLPRYGVTVGVSHGTLWFSGKQMKQPGLTLGC